MIKQVLTRTFYIVALLSMAVGSCGATFGRSRTRHTHQPWEQVETINKRKYKDGGTSLHDAVSRFAKESNKAEAGEIPSTGYLKYLLENGGNINIQDKNGRTPLHYVQKVKNPYHRFDILSFIFTNSNPDLTLFDSLGYNALQILLYNKERLGKIDAWLKPFITYARKQGVLERVLNNVNGNGQSVLDMARANYEHALKVARDRAGPFEQAIKLFSDSEGNSASELLPGSAQVFTALLGNDLLGPRTWGSDEEKFNTYYKQLKEAGQLTSITDYKGWTLLHHAVDKNMPELLANLLNDGADPLQKAPDPKEGNRTPSISPLHLALHKGDEEQILKLFLLLTENLQKSRSSEEIARILDDENILHVVVNSGSTGIIQTVLELGAAPNKKGEDGHTPLSRAAKRKDIESMKALLKNGASLDVIIPHVGYYAMDGIEEQSVKDYIQSSLAIHTDETDKQINSLLKEHLGRQAPRKPSSGKVGGPTPRPQPKPTLRGTGTPTGPTPQPITNGNGDGPGGPPSGDDDEWSPTKKVVVYGGGTLAAATAAALIYRWWKKRKEKLQKLGKPKPKPLGPMDGPKMPNANWGV